MTDYRKRRGEVVVSKMGCCASSPVVEDSTAVQQDGKLRKKEMPKEAIEALTAEGKTDALLAVVPGRIFANSASNHACIFTQQGRKGTNQDAMVVWEVRSILLV